MDCFRYDIYGSKIFIYRSIYAPVKSNMFVIVLRHDAIIIDPNKNEQLLNLLRAHNIRHAHVMLTHEHYDHVSGVEWLKEEIKTDICCQKNAAQELSVCRPHSPLLVAFVLAQQDKADGGNRYVTFKKSYRSYAFRADKTFDKRDSVNIGNLHFDVRSTPGHSQGSACYILDNHILFSGDSLLKNTPVIVRFQGGNEEDYRKVTLPFLRSLPRDMIVMPGHGDPFLLGETNTI